MNKFLSIQQAATLLGVSPKHFIVGREKGNSSFSSNEGEGCYGPMEFGQQPVAQLRNRGIL